MTVEYTLIDFNRINVNYLTVFLKTAVLSLTERPLIDHCSVEGIRQMDHKETISIVIKSSQ